MSDDNKKDPKKSKFEETLWQRVRETVKPLASRNLFHKSFSESLDEKPQRGKAHQSTKPIEKSGLFRRQEIHSPMASSQAQGKGGIDKRTDAKLRRGKLPIQAKLDLHGMRQNEAYSALTGFINGAYHQQKRVVLIITGKGYRSVEAGGILRRLVPIWLGEDPFKDKILSFHTAQPRDGGEGALYVLLRRDRSK